MANPLRGEVGVDVDGREYILRPKINACIQVEALTGKKFQAILQEAAQDSLDAFRALIWTYLQAYHGDEIKTLDDAGDWIDKAGGLAGLERKFIELNILNARPAGEDGGGNPTPAQATSTGEASSLQPVATLA